MSFKIQINSLAALERLLGGDTEFEIEMREKVAQDFAKKYLKGVVATEAMDKYVNQITSEVQKQAEQAFGQWNYKSFVLKPEVAAAICKVVNASIDEVVRTAISEELNRIMEQYTVDLEVAVQQQVNAKFKDIVDAEVEKRWNALKAMV